MRKQNNMPAPLPPYVLDDKEFEDVQYQFYRLKKRAGSKVN
jgi:hypothetical protein